MPWEIILKSPPQPVVPAEEDIFPQVFLDVTFLTRTQEMSTQNTLNLLCLTFATLLLCAQICLYSQHIRTCIGCSCFPDHLLYPCHPPERYIPKAYYFDAGASSWNSGAGGPSLSYFTEVWKRHGIDFDHIEAWAHCSFPRSRCSSSSSSTITKIRDLSRRISYYIMIKRLR